MAKKLYPCVLQLNGYLQISNLQYIGKQIRHWPLRLLRANLCATCGLGTTYCEHLFTVNLSTKLNDVRFRIKLTLNLI